MERKLGLSSRNENSRNMLVPDMHVSKLDEMYEQFCKNVETVKEKFHIAEQLDNVHEEKAVKDIYRSQIVFLESALDYFICIVLEFMRWYKCIIITGIKHGDIPI